MKRKLPKRSISSSNNNSNNNFNTEKDIVKFITDNDGLMAFCHIPKAASTTWMFTFAKINELTSNISELQNMYKTGKLHAIMFDHYGFLEDTVPESSFKFTFIRHPFERIVSIITRMRAGGRAHFACDTSSLRRGYRAVFNFRITKRVIRFFKSPFSK